MSAPNPRGTYTEAQYWQLEETALEKHEFVGGRIYQRAQSSLNHTAICANILASAHALLRGQSFRVFNSDMKIKVEATGDSFYPDTTIYASPAQFVGEGNHTLLTPAVLFEVTTPATTNFDHQGKLLFYGQIETLTDYVLIDSQRICVEHFSRDNINEDWRYRLHSQRSHVVRLAQLNVELPLSEIYDELDVTENWVEAQTERAQEEA